MERKIRWQDWVNVLFGVWLIISPFIWGYSDNAVAAWNSYILGIAVALFAIIALFSPQAWEEWVNLILGVWLIISPFVLAFSSGLADATWTNIIMGILVAGDSLWAGSQAGRQAAAH